MALSIQERIQDHQEALRLMLQGHAADQWTAMPGYIVDFNPTKQTATVQVGIRAKVTQEDGSVQSMQISVIPDVMVAFPNGGGHTLTFPIQAGDECHLVFSSRNHDAWYQSGGIVDPLDTRMHDLNDAVAYVGIRSQPNKLSSISTTTTQLRSDDGATYIEVDSTGKNVNVVAPTKVTITAPATQVNGPLTVTGLITSNTDVQVGTVTLKTHVHPGVQTGTGSTGLPVG